MKTLISLICALFISPSYAEIYKCIENGKTSYQQTQCKNAGEVFIPAQDISKEQQEKALNKLNAEIAADQARNQQLKSQEYKERMLQIADENAQANWARVQATEQRTEMLQNQIRNLNSIPPAYYPSSRFMPVNPGPYTLKPGIPSEIP